MISKTKRKAEQRGAAALKVDVFNQTDSFIDPEIIQQIGGQVIRGENTDSDGIVNIVFVDDVFIQQLNREYLQKDRPTDVIAFNLGADIFGEVYISLETARLQAEEYRVSFQEEVYRLVIHGLLHLLGHEDGTQSEREQMTFNENKYLKLTISQGGISGFGI